MLLQQARLLELLTYSVSYTPWYIILVEGSKCTIIDHVACRLGFVLARGREGGRHVKIGLSVLHKIETEQHKMPSIMFQWYNTTIQK